MTLANTNYWPVFTFYIFHKFRILEYSFSRNIIWMLLIFWSYQLKTSTGKKSTINLWKKFQQVLLGNIIRNSYRPTASPSYKIIICFHYIGFKIKDISILLTYGLCQYSNNWLVIETLIASCLILIAFLIFFPFITNQIRFCFNIYWWFREFLVSFKQGG